MRVSDRVGCQDWPCTDVDRDLFSVPAVEVDPARISIVLVSEVAAPRAEGGYYAGSASLFARTSRNAHGLGRPGRPPRPVRTCPSTTKRVPPSHPPD